MLRSLRKPLSVLLFFCFSSSVYAQETSPERMTVYFDFDKYVIKKSEAQRLDSLLKANDRDFRNLQFGLVGHCDSIGSGNYNQQLSEKRSKAIQAWLISHGAGKN